LYWISVEKDLPDPDEKVLLATDQNCYSTGEFIGGERLWLIDTCDAFDGEVSHWMKIIKPKKGELF